MKEKLAIVNTDMKRRWTNQLSVDWVAMYSDWDAIGSYQNENFEFLSQQAGSNSYAAGHFLEAEGDVLLAYLNFKYLQPLGDGHESAPRTFNVRNGILEPLSAARGAKCRYSL